VHGDPKCANVGIALDAGRRVVLLDWQFVTAAPPAVDLSWLLAMFATVLPCSLDEALEEYRAALARRLGSRFSEHWWQPQLDLALLGQFLRMGHMFMDRSHTEKWAPFHDHYKNLLAWWYPHVRAGAALL
jgi:aminoglycoside phosphotransferase (APT) family kinase protein